MLLPFPCGDCVRCNGLFDGSPSWKIERWIKLRVRLWLRLWRKSLGPLPRNLRRIDGDSLITNRLGRYRRAGPDGRPTCGTTTDGQSNSKCRNEGPTSARLKYTLYPHSHFVLAHGCRLGCG